MRTKFLIEALGLYITITFLSPVWADDMIAFGMPLGQDFSIPECEGASHGYNITANHVCFERISSDKYGPIVSDDTVKVRFPFEEAPSIAIGGIVIATVIDGKLEWLSFNTAGINDAETVLTKLKEKYGEPTTFLPRTVKTRIGASFQVFDCDWTRENIYVFFQSVSGSLESGLVQIATKKGAEHHDAVIKNLLKDKRPL